MSVVRLLRVLATFVGVTLLVMGATTIAASAQDGGYPGGDYPGEECPDGDYPGGDYPGGDYPGGDYPGEECPDETTTTTTAAPTTTAVEGTGTPTLPVTGGVAMLGGAGVLAAGALALRRLATH